MEDILTMALAKALAKKELGYELKGADMDFDFEIETPLLGDTDTIMKVKCKGSTKVEYCNFTITNSGKTEYGLE